MEHGSVESSTFVEGVLLLGGTGSRLGVLTHGLNKHLLPVYHRSLAENGLRWLILCGVTRVVAVVPVGTQSVFEGLLAPVAQSADCHVEVLVQQAPLGTADALRSACPYID